MEVMPQVTTEEITIRDGETKVFERRYFEVVQCETGVPICVATFSDETKAREYARACNRRRTCGHMGDICEEVITAAIDCVAKGDAQGLMKIDFMQALASIKNWREFK